MFGGVSMPENIYFNDLWVMDYEEVRDRKDFNELAGVTWCRIPTEGNKPIPRKGHISFVHKKSFIVWGGSGEKITDKTFDIYVLDLSRRCKNIFLNCKIGEKLKILMKH